MTVARILGDKGRHVVTIAPDRSVDEAAALMSGKRIGAVLATNPDGSIAGILSERDIVRALASAGAQARLANTSRHSPWRGLPWS